MAFRIPRRFLILPTLVLVVVAAGLGWYCHTGLERGRQLLQREQWSAAREELNRFLWLHPSDPEALLALAESYVRDDAESPRGNALAAVEILQRINDQSPRAVRARIQTARLRLLILWQPCEAERELQRALELDPRSFEANLLMWKLLDLTRRYHLAEPYFIHAFAAATPERRPQLLIDWYLSQFSTFSAATELDQMMGFSRMDQPSDPLVEFRRLQSFESSEPGQCFNEAMLAGWCDEYHLEEEKQKWFDKAWEHADSATPEFAFAVLFDILMDDGRFEEVRQINDVWPEPHGSYDYWSRQGIFFSEVETNPDHAIEACRKAMTEWPGPVDWRLQHRLAGLLTRTGQTQEADRVREEAHRLETLMKVDFHAELRASLTGERGAAGYRQLAEFYRSIQRPHEAEAWGRMAASLETPNAPLE
ncbi:MAG: hypothetical protein KDA85_04005 [Planctomycetaceae bacterium]|nr:hypothetical protein [Planctomycetaceae bacterium]